MTGARAGVTRDCDSHQKWEWVVVLVCDAVQVVIINAEMQQAILLLDKKDRCASWGVGRKNEAFSITTVQLLA